jgi:hypothetical protein
MFNTAYEAIEAGSVDEGIPGCVRVEMARVWLRVGTIALHRGELELAARSMVILRERRR